MILRYLPRALYLIARDLARAHRGALVAQAVGLSFVFVVLTFAAPQMTPMQTERAVQQIHGKLATLEDLIRKVERSNELHQDSYRSHAHYAAQIEAQALVLQAHSLRLAELDAVFRFVAYAISAAIGLLAIIATVVISLHRGHKKVVSEHHEMCEILQRMDARAAGRRAPG